LCDTNDTQYTRLDKTARVNTSLEQVIGELINADGTWQFDDSNYTNTPRGLADLTTGQNIYTFSDKLLQIEEVDILDINGFYRKITPWDSSEHSMSFEEYFGITASNGTYTAPAGFPQFYDKQSNVIRFDRSPTAAYATLTKGLRVIFKRTASLFTATSATTIDTTVPGFDSTYHVVLAYMASIPYCMTYKKDRVALYQQTVADLMRKIVRNETSREKDKPKVLKMASIGFM